MISKVLVLDTCKELLDTDTTCLSLDIRWVTQYSGKVNLQEILIDNSNTQEVSVIQWSIRGFFPLWSLLETPIGYIQQVFFSGYKFNLPSFSSLTSLTSSPSFIQQRDSAVSSHFGYRTSWCKKHDPGPVQSPGLPSGPPSLPHIKPGLQWRSK